MPTLQDVAKLAGVSTATVSKVLSNTPYVSEATRNKVLQAVQELGYRPNLAARALSSGKTRIIAVVFPFIYDAIFKDPLVMRILQGIESVCTEQAYNLLLSTPRILDEGVDEQFQRMVQSGYAEGLIAIDNVQTISFAAEAEKWRIPTVTLGYHPADYVVRSDDFSGGQQIMSHVLQQGHQRIGLISVPEGTNIAISARMRGARDAVSATNIDWDALPVAYGDFSAIGGAAAAEALLRRTPNLTCIVCTNDRMALGAISYLQKSGKRVPDDISVTGYDNIAAAAVSNPSLTTIDQTPVELGRQAAELLFQRLNDGQPADYILSPELIERDSVAPPLA